MKNKLSILACGIRNEIALSAIFLMAVILFLTEFFVFRTPFYPSGLGIIGDGRLYYAVARSIVIDGNMDLTNEITFVDRYGHPPIETLYAPGKVADIITPAKLGTSILEIPWVFVAHVLTKAVNLVLNKSIPEDGYSYPYQVSACFGNMLYGFAGLLFIYWAASKYFGNNNAFWAVAYLFVASPVIYYITYENSTYHMCEIFAVGLFVFSLIKCRETGYSNVLLVSALGFSMGLVFIVRFYDCVYFVLFAKEIKELFSRGGIKRALSLRNAAMLAIPAAFMYFLQSLLWKRYFGKFNLINVFALFADLLQKPHIIGILFTRFNNTGLVTAHPIYLFAITGVAFFYRTLKERHFYIPLTAVLIIEIYWNSLATDWASTGGFGMRRLLSALPVFAFGLAGLFSICTKKTHRIIVHAIMVFLVCWNLLYMQQWVLGRITQYGIPTAKQIFNDKFKLLLQNLGYFALMGDIELCPAQIDNQKYHYVNHAVNYFCQGETVIDVSRYHVFSAMHNKITEVQISASGSKAGGELPNMRVEIGDTRAWNVPTGSDAPPERRYMHARAWDVQVTETPKIYRFRINRRFNEIRSIKISFTNDYYDPKTGADRNLAVYGLRILLKR